MKKLDPKAVWLFSIQYSIGWIVIMLFFTFCFGFPFMSMVESVKTNTIGSFVVFSVLGMVLTSVFVILLSYVFAKLSYDNYKYELKEDGFYKESGVITKKFVTIPYERIQNVDINRGIFSRILGLSDLQIQTAGMSAVYTKNGMYGIGAEGRLPAVSEKDAVIIRDELIKRARGKKEQSGL